MCTLVSHCQEGPVSCKAVVLWLEPQYWLLSSQNRSLLLIWLR